MTKINLRLIFGAFLIIVGVILLLENLGLFELGSLVWTGILTVLASCFVVIYFRNHRLWWVWIPAVTLLSFAVQFALQDLAPAFERQYGEAIVLAGVALSFLTAYGFSTSNWWAVIPGGIFLTLSVLNLMEKKAISLRLENESVFYMGMGLTFALLYILPSPGSRKTWALFSGVVFLLFGIFFTISDVKLINIILPSLIILIGVLLLARNFLWRGTKI
jgi:hypothetical protein